MKKILYVITLLLLLQSTLAYTRYETSSFDYNDFNPKYDDFSSSFRKMQEVNDYHYFRKKYTRDDTYHEVKCEKGRNKGSSQNYRYYYEKYCDESQDNAVAIPNRVKKMNTNKGYKQYSTIEVRYI